MSERNDVVAAAARLRRAVWMNMPSWIVEAIRTVTDYVLATVAADAPNDREQFEKAIEIVTEYRRSHETWIEWYRRHPQEEHRHANTCGDESWHRQCIEGYDFVLSVLRSRQSTVAADDDEPIDEAWLLSVGGEADRECTYSYLFLGQEVLTVYLSASQGWRLRIGAMSCVGSIQLHSRGQFRLFCRALNIPLQPSGQEQGKDA